jgi:hypothetical protein
MRRRDFITLVGGAAAAWPLAAQAQPTRVARIGYVSGTGSAADPWAFRRSIAARNARAWLRRWEGFHRRISRRRGKDSACTPTRWGCTWEPGRGSDVDVLGALTPSGEHTEQHPRRPNQQP